MPSRLDAWISKSLGVIRQFFIYGGGSRRRIVGRDNRAADDDELRSRLGGFARRHDAFLIPFGRAGGTNAGHDKNEIVSAGYVYGYTTEITYRFVRDEMAKLVSADVISFDDKSLLNDAAPYEIWKVIPGDEDEYVKVYDAVQPGEKVYLADGKYFAALNDKTARENGCEAISLVTRSGQQLKKFFDPDIYPSTTGMIDFTDKNGKPDRALKFYVRKYDPDFDRESELDPEVLAKYEELWGDSVLG